MDIQTLISLEGPLRLKVPKSELKSVWVELESQGYFVTEVDRAPVFNKEILLHALYQSCRFPAYFGFNWDALSDCLGEVTWGEEKGYFLIFNDWVLLESEAPQDAQTFLEILEDIRSNLKSEGKPLHLLTAALD